MATTVRIDPEKLQNSAGFSFDIGGSAAKVAYRSKEHHSGGKPESKDFAGLVSVEIVKDATSKKIADLVREKCDLTARGHCFSTGSLAGKYQQSLQESLGVSITNLSEADTFIKAISSFSQTAKDASDMFMEKPQEAIKEAEQQIQMFMSYQAAIKDKTATTLDFATKQEAKSPPSPEVQYPYVLVTCGSAISFILVQKEGPNKVLGMTNLGGRAFMGLSKALTGVQDFQSLNALMEGANGRTVDEWASDTLNPGAKSDIYNSMPGDVVVYRLGKLNRFTLDEVKKEDVAQSLASLFAINAATLTLMHCKVLGAKNAYLCGNFVSNCPVFRHNFTSSFTLESSLNTTGEPINFEFLAHGGFLGVLGALMNDPPLSVHL